MTKLPGSIEVKLNVKLSKSDILAILAEYMTVMEENFGIEEFKLYSFIEGYIDNEKQAIIGTDNEGILKGFKFKSFDKIENTSKRISVIDEKRVIEFDKKLDIKLINQTVEKIQTNNPYSFNSCRVVKAKDAHFLLTNIINKKNETQYIERERIKEIKRLKEKEIQDRIRLKYKPLEDFIENKISESGLSQTQFKKKICSDWGYLSQTAAKNRYFAEYPDLKEKYKDIDLIRYSIKNENGKVYKIEIYNLEGELLVEYLK